MSTYPILDPARTLIDPTCAPALSAAFAFRTLTLPLARIQGSFCLACENPTSERVAQLTQLLKCPIQLYQAPLPFIREHLLKLYGEGLSTREIATPIWDDPIACVETLLRSALLRHASDIHFDPTADGLRVRFRTDGLLEDVTTLPPSVQNAVTSRLKILAGLNIAERRAPQDGAFVWRAAGRHLFPTLDIRLATLPVRHGERLTLRLLETEGSHHDLEHLGLCAHDLSRLQKALARPQGLILLTGPTGSGKTTTLYAAIRALLSQGPRNILTVEDPIEYEIPGTSQAEIDHSDKVNFSKALKSLLRHDPDVIMIGEIRDRESLDAAVKAALTGHLVLSTLHTQDARSVPTRLKDMGLDPTLIPETVSLCIAQRLVRKLCPFCRKATPLSHTQALALGDVTSEGKTSYEPVGCLACAGRGYHGRLGLFEFYAPHMENQALSHTFREDARQKCLLGETSPAEVLRILGDDLLA